MIKLNKIKFYLQKEKTKLKKYYLQPISNKNIYNLNKRFLFFVRLKLKNKV